MPERERPSRTSLSAGLLLGLTALVAVLPLLLRGPSCGHDFDFHLLSWLEAAQQLAHGGWPRWAFTPAWNAGEPRFVFYPPLSWLLGSALGLALQWTWVPAAYTWCALTAAGLTMRRWLAETCAPANATLGAAIYLAHPYMLFTAYERTAYGELLAAAWLPLLLAAVLAPRVRVSRLAVPITLLWLTNAPAAVMGCYAAALVLAVRLLLGRPGRRKRRLAWASAGGVALGLALAGVYLVPAVVERPLVETSMAVTEGMRPVDHTLFHRMLPATDDTLFHDAVVRSASWLAVGLLVGISVLVGVRLVAKRKAGPPPAAKDDRSRARALYERLGWPEAAVPLGVLILAIAFLLTPPSLPVWAHLPQLAYLQFPWRLTALLGAVFAYAAACVLPALPARATLLAPLLAAALALPAAQAYTQPCDAADALPGRVAQFHDTHGTEPTDEYTPTDADPDALHPDEPGWWLAGPADVDRPAPSGTLPGQAPSRLTLDPDAPTLLVLNRRAYPLWQMRLNGLPVILHQPARADGLLSLDLPAGPATVELLPARPWEQIAGPVLSAAALAVLLALRRRRV